ncbi:MAG: preprotein translocase subunit SecE [Micrococcaceae bacterium]
MSEEQVQSSDVKLGFFARIALFIRQVIAELKKVTVPTPKELLNYTIVVLAFVVVMMLFVSLLDLVFGQLVIWLFANSAS